MKKAVAGGADTWTALIQPYGWVTHQPIAAIANCNNPPNFFGIIATGKPCPHPGVEKIA